MKKITKFSLLSLTANLLATSAYAGLCETKYSDPALNHACQSGQEAKAQGDATFCTKMSIVGSREDKTVYNACDYGYQHADRSAQSKESTRKSKPAEHGTADSQSESEHSESGRAN